MAAPRKHRLNVPPPEQTAGRKAGSGTVGYPNQPFSVPQSASLGLGTQAGATPDPPWLQRTPDDPLGWKSLAAHAAAAANPVGAANGTVDLSWLPGSWADPLFWQQIAQNVKTSGNADAQSITDRNLGLTNLGYNFQFDPNDPFTPTAAAPTVDTTNPFSQAMQLKTHYEAAQRGDTNNLASRGQLYSGALGNQLGLDTTAFDQGTDTLLKGAHALIDTAVRNHGQNVLQFGPGGNTGQAGLDAIAAGIGRQKPTDVPQPTDADLRAFYTTGAGKPTGATAAPKAKYAGTPTDLPPVRRYTGSSFVPQGGVVPGVKPKPYAKPKIKPYTGKSFVPFGGK